MQILHRPDARDRLASALVDSYAERPVIDISQHDSQRSEKGQTRMTVRRIVTGYDSNGKSVFKSDGPAPRSTAFKHVPGFVTTLVWETKPGAQIPAADGDPSVTASSWVPAPGATSFMFVTFPPDSVAMSPDFDPVKVGAEYAQVLPGLADKFEADHPGMHTTDTVDYGLLVDGEVDMELDDGAAKTLTRGDVVIQNGTRHAIRNKSDRPATMMFVMVGTKRS